jgi:ribosomal protein S13
MFGCAAMSVDVLGGLIGVAAPEPAAKVVALQLFFVTLSIRLCTLAIAVRLTRAVADDIERAVAILACHGDRHDSNPQLHKQHAHNNRG